MTVKHDRAQPGSKVPFNVRAGPSGVHLFNRTTGINILLDEVQVPASLWAAAPRHVSFALTNACDLACSYCYAPKYRSALNVESLCQWLDELDANGCIGVGFGGGEPTLYRDLPELCRHATQKTGLAVTLTTHGHHLDDALVAALYGNVHFVRISMDGIGTTYELLRGRSFAALLRRLEIVRSLAPFGINYVVNSRTLPELSAATTLASDLGAAEFLLLPEQPTKGSGGVDPDTVVGLREWVACNRGTIAMTVSEAGADGLPTCNPFPRETGLSSYAHVDAAGDLKRSSFDSGGTAIGEDGLMRALKVLRAQEEAQL